MKEINQSELKTNDLVEITQIDNPSGVISASLECQTKGQPTKHTYVDIKSGGRFLFQKISPEHLNDALFLIPGISENVELWIEEASLKECRLTLVDNDRC